MSAPTFDCEQATAHLGAIAPDGGIVFVGTVDRARSFTLPHELEGALDHAASLVAAGCDCFVTPGLFERDSDGSVSRDLAHVRGAWLAWCDVDGWDDGREGIFDELRAAFPSGVVFRLQSSPGRYHVYVRLDSEAHATTIRQLNDRLVAVVGGDPAPAQPATWMRLAGTVHQPKAQDRSDPARNVPAAIVFVEGPGEHAVDLEWLTEVLEGLQPPPSAEEWEALERLIGMRQGGGRNAAMARYAGHVARRCRNDRATYDRALASANEMFAEPLGAREVAAVARSIWTREHGKPAREHKAAKPSQATQLVALAGQRYDLFRDVDTDMAVAVRKGAAIGRPLKGSAAAMSAELAAAFFEQTNAVPSGTALADAMKTLDGLALAAPAVPFALRVGRAADGTIYYDLGDDPATFVHIEPGRWTVVDNSPIYFLRTGLTEVQVTPVQGGSLEELQAFFPLTKQQFVLLLGWMVAALLPEIPHPVAYLSGERGTGKSTTASHVVDLVDPVRVERRTAPSDVQGWAALARAAWMTYLDNLSGIPGWFSDVLCCAVTGGGNPFRKLYTDDDLHVINIKRPIMLSGIDLGAIRDDLADRMVHIEHDVMPANERRSERELEAAWAAACARNFGALLDLAAEVLQVLPDITLPDSPRMADFTEVLAAIDQILDTNSVELYRTQADDLDDRALEADQVGVAVVLLMSSRRTSSLTPTKLLAKLHDTLEYSGVKVDERWWPKNPTSLTKRLKRVAPLLRKRGIELTFHKRTNKERRIEIRKTEPSD